MQKTRFLAVIVSIFVFVSSASQALDRAYLLSSNREALSARLTMLATSRAPFLCAFEIAEDHVGLALLAGLIQSAKNGGHPKLLIDALGHHLSPDMIRYLIEQNVEVRLFRSSYLSSLAEFGFGELNQRMHNKILTDETGGMITGGRNSRDPFFGLEPNHQNFIDFDVLVRGDSARAARAYQEELWVSPIVQTPYHYWLPQFVANALRDKIAGSVRFLKKAGILAVRLENFDSKLSPARVTFVHDDVTDKTAYTESSIRGSARALIEAINRAKSEILIDSQYLILTPEIAAAFSKAVHRGVHVEIATNGSGAFSTPADGIERAAFEMYKPELRATGVTVHEYEGPGKIHSKSAVIDRSLCLVWSMNLDPRSQNINYEAGAEISDPLICGQLASHLIAHMQRAPVTIKDGKSLVADRIIPGVERALIESIRGEL